MEFAQNFPPWNIFAGIAMTKPQSTNICEALIYLFIFLCMPCKWPTGRGLLALGVIQGQSCRIWMNVHFGLVFTPFTLVGDRVCLEARVFCWVRGPGPQERSLNLSAAFQADLPRAQCVLGTGYSGDTGWISLLRSQALPRPVSWPFGRQTFLPAGGEFRVFSENPRARTSAAVREGHQQAITALFHFPFFN